MDNHGADIERQNQQLNLNGSTNRHQMSPGRPTSLADSNNQTFSHFVVKVVVNRDDRGYGMKVSGDNPVYVQSVKEGGAAEKAGLHAGDKIIKVNDVNVMSSKHTDVVDLIRASSSVVLTVQQKQKMIGSPSYNRSPISPSTTRITGPQPVDNEKQHQLQLEKEQHYRLMIEKEQRYIDALRSQLAASPDEKKHAELLKTEKNLQTLQLMLQRNQIEQSPSESLNCPLHTSNSPTANSNCICPPPLPKRNPINAIKPRKLIITNQQFLNEEINANTLAQPQVKNDGGGGVNEKRLRLKSKSLQGSNRCDIIDNPLYTDHPPPLPPRLPISGCGMPDSDAVNSISKQMLYPLVATCATLVNDYSPTHQRTKSSPESLSLALSTTQSSNIDLVQRKLKASESMNDLTHEWDEHPGTPPGTPPPPYPSPLANRRRPYTENNDEMAGDCSSPDTSPFRSIVANSSVIHAANTQLAQQPIISMEDDEISDQEMLEDHGHFKSLSRLWEHPPHLAVFMNYILSNTDPNSLLFYLLTDLYKEGNAKEMRKWAFEIHSSFLVPGAPLRLCNVDENIAREIDDVLTREYDKEEILRKIFWKARSRAKEELTKQLENFQQKLTAGLGTIFGPPDQYLLEIYNDKAKETKLYETLFLEKLDHYLDNAELENCDPKRYYTAAALTTVLTRIFGIRPNTHTIDRYPTFVSKEKSFRTKFIGKYYRKLSIQGHQFVAQQYYTVIVCNNCHQIIYGIGPQGYQCSVCLINLHRWCVKLYDDQCPGPINRKEKGGLGKFIRIRSENNENRRKHSSNFINMERERRQAEEKDSPANPNESGENKPTQPVSRSGSDRRPDVVREEISKSLDSSGAGAEHGHDRIDSETSTLDHTTPLSSSGNKKRATSNINRSESVKQQAEKRKQQRRNKSDPSHHNTASGDVELDQPGLSHTDSGSSSNSSISYNDRLSESPCNSSDILQDGRGNDKKHTSDWESDTDMEPGSWHKLFADEELRKLQPHEIKRQDIINELFHTESTHVRNLRVLYQIFYRALHEHHALKSDELSLIFPNIKELFNIHLNISDEMKSRRQVDPLVSNLGDMLVNMFGGTSGISLQKAAATFCERQQLALEFIKDKRIKGTKFDLILIECEKKRQCRRLPLQGILPTEMQRLSKYPLLIERIINSMEGHTSSKEEQEELLKLKRALELSKEILNYVNEATKLAWNRARLEDIQKRLDTSNFERLDNEITKELKTLDLTKYNLIKEGKLHLRRPNKAAVPVHVLLLDEAVIILHKEGDRYILKFFQSGTSYPFSPIIKMSSLLVRTNASSKTALFLINTVSTNTQMYELASEDVGKCDTSETESGENDDQRRGSLSLGPEKRRGSLITRWFKHFSDAADAFNKREGKTKLPDPDDTETTQDLPTTVTERAESVEEPILAAANQTTTPPKDGSTNVNNVNSSNNNNEEDEFTDAQDGVEKENSEGGGVHTKITPDEWPLIQPSQVHVEVPPVHIAESRLTSLEEIRRKDEEVRQAIEAKEGLVADLLSIPREDFHHIADMASQDPEAAQDLTGRVMVMLYQVDQFRLTINKAVSVDESSAIAATGGKFPSCKSQDNSDKSQVPVIPAHLCSEFANSFSTHLTNLLSYAKHVEEERDNLRKELHRRSALLHENAESDETVVPTPETLVLDSNQDRSTESES